MGARLRQTTAQPDGLLAELWQAQEALAIGEHHLSLGAPIFHDRNPVPTSRAYQGHEAL
jgi:hypothetical protein